MSPLGYTREARAATRKIRALIERPERCTFWGQSYTITPRLIGHAFGDGKRLVCITPIMTRPNYFVARVDSTTKSVLDRCVDCRTKSPWGVETLLDAISYAQEEKYGFYDEDDEDGNREDRGFPFVDWSDGCCCGTPFPVADWKPTKIVTIMTGCQRTRSRWRKQGRR